MEKYLHWYISPVCILIHMHVHRCSVHIDIWAFNGGVGETVNVKRENSILFESPET